MTIACTLGVRHRAVANAKRIVVEIYLMNLPERATKVFGVVAVSGSTSSRLSRTS